MPELGSIRIDYIQNQLDKSTTIIFKNSTKMFSGEHQYVLAELDLILELQRCVLAVEMCLNQFSK